VMVDSGVRSGLDVVRAVALGADAAFAGKAFLWGLGALGAEGPLHVIDLMIDEMKSATGQLGALSLNQFRKLTIRHPGVFCFEAEQEAKTFWGNICQISLRRSHRAKKPHPQARQSYGRTGC